MIEQRQVSFGKDDFLMEGTVYILPPNPEMSYKCGISIFIPKNCQDHTTMIMRCCNTGNHVPLHLEEANEIAKRSTYENPLGGIWLGHSLQMPVMTPLIPRVQGYYTQALGSDIIRNDMTTLIDDQLERTEEEKLTDEEMENIRVQCMDIPEQVAHMIPASIQFLKEMDIHVDDKVIIEGYSAGSKFANRFTALHPELIKACIGGGTGGICVLPITEYNGERLNYPLGVADIPAFDHHTFCQIPQFYYIGTEDQHDPFMPKEDDKNVCMYKETCSQHEFEQIHRLLGSDIQTRFDRMKDLYAYFGVNASFQKFPGNHATVTENHTENYFYTNEAIKNFINSVTLEKKEIENESSPVHK